MEQPREYQEEFWDLMNQDEDHKAELHCLQVDFEVPLHQANAEHVELPAEDPEEVGELMDVDEEEPEEVLEDPKEVETEDEFQEKVCRQFKLEVKSMIPRSEVHGPQTTTSWSNQAQTLIM